MKLKKFQAESMPEALNQIRTELGSDAVILHTKEITAGGWFGFFAKKKLEVTAAVDPVSNVTPNPKVVAAAPEIKRAEVIKSPALVKQASQIERMNVPDIILHLDRELEKQDVHTKIRHELKEDLFGFWYSQDKEKRTPLAVYNFTKQWFKKRLQEVKIGSSLFDKKYMIFAVPQV
ncbi:hypothetical protein [Alkalicoccobacillus plakortidis]|uniref:Uncharacterized protein n=1 Tax=Alkalicoccobacillus plakortidis TaxID=444060 RepID=A0ABT0XFQ2_9BACI|nr:hypothetical protein [Alkalicoccobacillus plakortidis]MCM2674723.1 hypothetical protein [Alkalicoccobacillus plakortidis]